MLRPRLRMAYWLYRRTFRPVGRALWRLDTHGDEHLRSAGPLIVIANHSSLLDAFVLLAALDIPIRYVITWNFYRLWTMRWFFWTMGTIPIGGASGLLTAFKKVAEVLKGEGIIGLFPEGRISRDGRMQPFQTGVANLALRHGAAVQPVYIRGSFEALPRWATWPRFNAIEFFVGPAIPVERIARPGEDDVLRLTAEIQAAVASLAERAVAAAPSPATR